MTQASTQPLEAADATAATPKPAAPWWRFGMVWLVLGGPAVVVVASFVTLALALRYGDPVISVDAAQSSGAKVSGVTPNMPAMQGRNHAATPAP